MSTLFDMGKPDLVMIIDDLADSDDPLEIYLQRRGWDLMEVKRLQASISEKLTVDMFTNEARELSSMEKTLQDDIQKYLDEVCKND